MTTDTRVLGTSWELISDEPGDLSIQNIGEEGRVHISYASSMPAEGSFGHLLGRMCESWDITEAAWRANKKVFARADSTALISMMRL